MSGRIISIFGGVTVSKESTLTIEMINNELQIAKTLAIQGLWLLKIQSGIFDSAASMGGMFW